MLFFCWVLEMGIWQGDIIQKHEDLNEFELQKKEEELKLKEDRRRSDLKELQLKQKELELKKDGIKRLDLFFEEKRKFLENLVRELREGELSREKTLSVKKWIDDFEKDLDKEHEALKLEQTKIDERLHTSKEKNKSHQNPELCEGTRVIIKSLNRNGELIREEKKGKWLVAIDNLKLTIAEDDMEACENQEKLKLSKPIVSTL